MIASGTFRMKATKALEFVKSPEKGTPGVSVTCTYLSGPNAGSTIEWVGWLSDKTTARTSESLATMGYDGEDPSTVTRNEWDGVTEDEEYEKADGTKGTRPRLMWVNGGSRMVAMSAAEISGAKDRLRSALTAARAKAAPAEAPAADVPDWAK